MRKNMCKLLVALFCVALLCGCAHGRSLGDRAIVKMIYLDESDRQIQAGLVVFTCAPNSDSSSAQGEAKIYLAQGDSIEEALYHAEESQNKKPFYAQNEILLLGPGAAGNVTEYLNYFSNENAVRPNLAVFLSPLDSEAFSECEDNIGRVVTEAERMIGADINGQDRTQSIYELNFSQESGLDGYLPVFSFSEDEKDFCGVKRLVLFRDGVLYGMAEDVQMQMLLLLSGKADRLTIHTQIDGATVAFRTQQAFLSRQAGVENGVPSLNVCLSGKLDDITWDGVPVESGETARAAQAINAYLDQVAASLNQATFCAGNDVFHSVWWMQQYDAALCDALLQADRLYETAQVTFCAHLEPA